MLTPVHPRAWANVDPATKPGYPLRMVSPAATNWTSVQPRPASPSAASAACTPYSTKLRPHFPHGCMPTPRTATSRSRIRRRSLDRLPLPDHVLIVVVLEQRAQRELHLFPHTQRL